MIFMAYCCEPEHESHYHLATTVEPNRGRPTAGSALYERKRDSNANNTKRIQE